MLKEKKRLLILGGILSVSGTMGLYLYNKYVGRKNIISRLDRDLLIKIMIEYKKEFYNVFQTINMMGNMVK